MTTRRTMPSVSRRAALAGLAGGGLGLALTGARGVAAQEASPAAMAAHPMVGAWSFDFDPEHPGTLFVYTSFHADGTRTDVHPFAGTGIGAWRPTGDRTAESILKYQNIATTPGDFAPGTVTVWESLTVDENEDISTREDVVELRAIDGTVVALFPFTGEPAHRLTVEPPPVVETPVTPTSATPAS
jgi:hypothetical protein